MKDRPKIKRYLSDFDNLHECGCFPDDNIEDFVFHHKDMRLVQFLSTGRELIRSQNEHIDHLEAELKEEREFVKWLMYQYVGAGTQEQQDYVRQIFKEENSVTNLCEKRDKKEENKNRNFTSEP